MGEDTLCLWDIIFLPFRLVGILFGLITRHLVDIASHSVGWSGAKSSDPEERVFVEEVVRSVEAVPLSRWKRSGSSNNLEARTDNGATILIRYFVAGSMSYSIHVDGREIATFQQSSNSYTDVTQLGYIGVKRAVDRIVKFVTTTERAGAAPAQQRHEVEANQQQIEEQIEARTAERRCHDDILRKLK